MAPNTSNAASMPTRQISIFEIMEWNAFTLSLEIGFKDLRSKQPLSEVTF